MADSPEVYAFREMSAAIYPGGGSETALAYCQGVELSIRNSFAKFFFPNTGQSTAERTQFHLVGREVQVSVEKMFTGPSLFQAFLSGTAFNAKFYWGGPAGYTATFAVWSASMTEMNIGATQGGLFRNRVVFQAADVSGY